MTEPTPRAPFARPPFARNAVARNAVNLLLVIAALTWPLLLAWAFAG